MMLRKLICNRVPIRFRLDIKVKYRARVRRVVERRDDRGDRAVFARRAIEKASPTRAAKRAIAIPYPVPSNEIFSRDESKG